MSPPIRDGSGSSIESIRLGDGSEIAEVRTGAGDVVFSGIPDSATWRTPAVASAGGLRKSASNSVDDDTSSFAVLESGSDGFIEFSHGSEFKAVRFDFNGTSGAVDVTLEPSGTVLKDRWNVSSGFSGNIISLKDELGAANYKTNENIRVQIDDTTNKRVAEVDVDINV